MNSTAQTNGDGADQGQVVSEDRKQPLTDQPLTDQPLTDWDVVVIGSGLGGLTAGALLARYGRSVLVCEAHTVPGGAAHDFERQGFRFDSGPSFYCGLQDPHSANPLRQVLQILGESIDSVPYDPLGHYHFPEATIAVHGNSEDYQRSLQTVADTLPEVDRDLAQQFANFEAPLLRLYQVLRQIPVAELRGDWAVLLGLFRRHPQAMAQLLPFQLLLQGSAGQVMDRTVRDPWLRRLIDVECFLLSGMKAHDTVAPEMAFMLGERSQSVIDYPVGGSGAIVAALVRGLERWGGRLRLRCPVAKILVEKGRAIGVRLANGEEIRAKQVISNATVWDTYGSLLDPEDIPAFSRQKAMATPAVESFMHLHLGIRAEGLEHLTGHHVVVQRSDLEITVPGNTCMISIPTVWDPHLAPSGYHNLHAYTLEPFKDWAGIDRNSAAYQQRKRERAQPLFAAVERVIPDLRQRLELELIGTPLTHARFLRRHQGTYGPAIAASQRLFPSGQTPIQNLHRVGDSTLPGIGVPAVVASGLLCANRLGLGWFETPPGF
ncbi:MAG: NAD(P)/FAD-dependent oxidoreductase [Prochlorothrix sp.]|nr:NAD(P)/FAD-dependent oxidoreductase [Prochlorothrix sp.]